MNQNRPPVWDSPLVSSTPLPFRMELDAQIYAWKFFLQAHTPACPKGSRCLFNFVTKSDNWLEIKTRWHSTMWQFDVRFYLFDPFGIQDSMCFMRYEFNPVNELPAQL